MNQSIRQQKAVLEALQQRFNLSASEMFQKTGRQEPVRAPRFHAVPLGGNKFDVIERATGRSRGACEGHGKACARMDSLEAQADAMETGKNIVKGFARSMFRWTCGIAAMVTLFALYGATR